MRYLQQGIFTEKDFNDAHEVSIALLFSAQINRVFVSDCIRIKQSAVFAASNFSSTRRPECRRLSCIFATVLRMRNSRKLSSPKKRRNWTKIKSFFVKFVSGNSVPNRVWPSTKNVSTISAVTCFHVIFATKVSGKKNIYNCTNTTLSSVLH